MAEYCLAAPLTPIACSNHIKPFVSRWTWGRPGDGTPPHGWVTTSGFDLALVHRTGRRGVSMRRASGRFQRIDGGTLVKVRTRVPLE